MEYINFEDHCERELQQGRRRTCEATLNPQWGLFQFIIGALLRNDVHVVECRGSITEIWEGMKRKVWTNNAPVLKQV